MLLPQHHRESGAANVGDRDPHNTVDVVWEDGTWQRGVPSMSLIASVANNDHDFPGQRVVPVSSAAGTADAKIEILGINRNFSYEDQTVRMAWVKGDNQVDTTRRP